MSQPSSAGVRAAAGGSVIHDIGYQRYTGPRLGSGYAWRSLYAHSLRSVFGLGRTGKAKIFPWAIVVICVGMAVLFAWLGATLDVSEFADLPKYLDFPDYVTPMVTLFLAVASPELVSRDLRNRTLPLYFSRPLGRAQYPLAKISALATALFFLLGAPQLVLFLGAAFADKPWIPPVSEELPDFLQGLGYAAIYAVFLACVGILIASLASRRGFAAGAIVAYVLVTSAFMGVLMGVAGGRGDLAQIAPVVSPYTLMAGLKEELFDGNGPGVGEFGPVYVVVALGLIIISLLLTLARYRKVST